MGEVVRLVHEFLLSPTNVATTIQIKSVMRQAH